MCSFTLSYYDTPTDQGGYFYWWYVVYKHSGLSTFISHHSAVEEAARVYALCIPRGKKTVPDAKLMQRAGLDRRTTHTPVRAHTFL